jgi:hypothetical protein
MNTLQTFRPITDIYRVNPELWHVLIGLLIFGGVARIAFWRDEDGLRIGGPLAIGLGLLLTIAIIIWADENQHRISQLGGWAAFILIEAILVLFFSFRRKAKKL